MHEARIVMLVCMAPAAAARQKDSETLAESIRSYNDGIRWQRYEMAASARAAAERAQFVDEWTSARRTSRSPTTRSSGSTRRPTRRRRSRSRSSWYSDSEGILRETHAMQTWERHGKTWFMVEETRLRGDRDARA